MKRIIGLLLCAAICLCLFSSCGGEQAQPSQTGLSVGYGKVNVSPSMSLPLEGYQGNDAPEFRWSTTVEMPFYAICVAFTDGNGNTALLMTLDMLIAYMADGSYQFYAVGSVPKANRIGHCSVADNLLHLIKFTREGGKDMVMVNWQGHSPGTDPKTIATSNYPSALRNYLENNMNCHAVFVLGGSGNLNNSSQIPGEIRHHNYQELGENLGVAAMEAAANFTPMDVGEVIVKEKVTSLSDRTTNFPKGTAEIVQGELTGMLAELFKQTGKPPAEKPEGYLQPEFMPKSDGVVYQIPNPEDMSEIKAVQNGFYAIQLQNEKGAKKCLVKDEKLAKRILQRETVTLLFDQQNVIVGIAD